MKQQSHVICRISRVWQDEKRGRYFQCHCPSCGGKMFGSQIHFTSISQLGDPCHECSIAPDLSEGRPKLQILEICNLYLTNLPQLFNLHSRIRQIHLPLALFIYFLVFTQHFYIFCGERVWWFSCSKYYLFYLYNQEDILLRVHMYS